MSDFLQQVSSFLNLNKLVAVTLPGIVATLALVLFFTPVPCPKDSQNCWYCMGRSSEEEVSKPKAGAAARPQGTYWVSKLSWEQANQSYKTLENISQTNLTACAQLPEYVVSSSRLKSEKETAKNLGDLVPVDPGSLLEDLDGCNSALTAAQAQIATRDAAKSNIISNLTTNVNDLNTALDKARAAVNPALERALTTELNKTRSDLERETRAESDLKAAGGAATALVNQVSDWRKAITSDVSAAIPVETQTTWEAAVQTLGSHILIFLLVSIMVGQLLDPIQRAIVSSDPMRGLTFPFLNYLYTVENPIGSVRFGDQRYPGTRRRYVKSLLKREPHLLEPSYAIGRGLLTQAEYSSLQDEFYRESQISTGLILPLLMLALAIYIRLLCCGVVKFGHGEVWICALLILTLWFWLLAFLVRNSVEGEERERQEGPKLKEECKREEERKRVEKELEPLEGERKHLKERLERPSLLDDERKSIEERQQRVEEQLKPLEKKLQSLEEAKPVRPETDYQERRQKHREWAGLILSGAPLAVATLGAAYACLNHFFGWGVLWCAAVTSGLVALLFLVVHTVVKRRKPKRLLEERSRHEKECKRLERESELPEEKRKRLEEDRKRLEEESKRGFATRFFVGILSLLVAVVVFFAIVSHFFLCSWPLVGLAVGLPTLQVLCLTAGSDRLHKFYSEVQARIVGAAKKQQESQIKKFADILTDPKPKQSFIEELKKRGKEINDIMGPLRGEVPQIEKAIDLLTDPKMKEAFIKELRKRRKKIDDLLRPLGW